MTNENGNNENDKCNDTTEMMTSEPDEVNPHIDTVYVASLIRWYVVAVVCFVDWYVVLIVVLWIK